MSPRIPLPVTLRGRFVELEPLHEGHLATLTAALHHPAVFAGGWGGGAAAYDPDPGPFPDFLRGYLGAERPFVVRLLAGPDAGTVVGTTSLGEWEASGERVHLGWTAYDPRVWGSVVNAECKMLLLSYVFEHGWGRVKIQADVLNARSIGAIARLGATREGVVRRDKTRADGTWRDAVVFSVIVDDWGRVHDGLRSRVFVSSFAVMSALGSAVWQEVPDSTLAAYPAAPAPLTSTLACQDSRFVGSGGALHQVSTAAFDASGAPVSLVAWSTCQALGHGAPLVVGPVLLKAPDSDPVYAIVGGVRRPVASMSRLYELTNGGAPMIGIVPGAALDALPLGPPA